MKSLPTSSGLKDTRQLYKYVFLSYFIGLGVNLPLLFEYKTEVSKDCYPLNPTRNSSNEEEHKNSNCFSPYVPWLESFYDGNIWTAYKIMFTSILYVIPKLDIVTMNIVTIIKLRSLLQKHLLQSNTIQQLVSQPTGLSSDIQIVSETVFRSHKKKAEGRKKRKKHEMKITRLLLAIMISHTILTTPCNSINFMFYFSFGVSKKFNHVITSVVNLMFTLNYSLNFYLYCFTNR